MKVVSWISEKILSRVATIVGGLVVTRVESDALNAHFDQLEDLENRARQLESDGKTELAQRLREHALAISMDRPGQQATKITCHLDEPNQGAEITGSAKPKRICEQTTNLENGIQPSKRKRGRPPKAKNPTEAK